jgi:hypothetical protein
MNMNSGWVGMIDSATLWNDTLNASDIATLYNSGTGIQWGDVDTTPPTLSSPANQSATYGTWTGVKFNATDNVGVTSFTVNDTLFNISSTGALNKTAMLGVANYLINVSANDSANNTVSTIFALNVTQATGTASAYINNSDEDLSIPYIQSNITMNCTTTGQTNTSTINSSAYAVGVYYSVCTLANSQNYTGATSTKTLEISKATGVAYAYINYTRANLTIMANPNNWTNLIYCNCTTFGQSYANSVNFTNYTVGANPITCTLASSQNYTSDTETWYINVLAYVDSEKPLWQGYTGNATATGTWNGTDFNATDNIGIKGYYVNDSNFSINSSGYLTLVNASHNTTFLVNVSVNDTSDNVNWTIFNLNFTEVDSTPPNISAPPNASIVLGETWGGVNFTATDNWAIANWSVNHSYFTINASGFLNAVNNSIPVANYTINVSLNDTSGNNASVLYNFEVSPYVDLIFPIFASFPADVSIPYFTAFTPVNITVTDDYSFGDFSVNDSNFKLLHTGGNANLTWFSQRPVGVYLINISAWDSANNTISRLFNINVTPYNDTVTPYFTVIPANATIVWGTIWNGGQFIGLDNYGTVNYSTNDTGFNMTSGGWLRKNTSIPYYGEYYVQINLSDNNSNSNYTVYNLNVTIPVPAIYNPVSVTILVSARWDGAQLNTTYGLTNFTSTNAEFVINTSGFMTFVGNYTVGNHSTNITGYDSFGNISNVHEFNLELRAETGLNIWVCPSENNSWWFVTLILAIAVGLIAFAFISGEGLFGFFGGLTVMFSYLFIGACAPIITLVIPVAGLLMMGYFILYYSGKD